MRISKRTWQRPVGGGRGTAWEVTYKDAGGTRRRRQFDRRNEAEAFSRRVSSEIYHGEHAVAAERTTLREAARVWLDTLRVGRDGEGPIATATRIQYEWALKSYILPRIGDLRLSALTRPVLLGFRDSLLTGPRVRPESGADAGHRPLARGSARRVLKALKACLNEARRRGLVATDTWRDVSIKEGARHRVRVEMPDLAAVRSLLTVAAARREHADPHTAFARHRTYALVAAAAMTGLRQGELRALTWRCVQFKRQLIRVECAADVMGIISSPKSARSRREVELPPELTRILKEWKLVIPGSALVRDLVFPRVDGGVLDKSNLFHRGWVPLRQEAGLPSLRFHALRHYYASSMIADGATPREVMDAMGHSSVQITFDVYGHLFPEDRQNRSARASRLARSLL